MLNLKQDFWKGGRRFGLDSDASCHIVVEDSPFIVNKWTVQEETSNAPVECEERDECMAMNFELLWRICLC